MQKALMTEPIGGPFHKLCPFSPISHLHFGEEGAGENPQTLKKERKEQEGMYGSSVFFIT